MKRKHRRRRTHFRSSRRVGEERDSADADLQLMKNRANTFKNFFNSAPTFSVPANKSLSPAKIDVSLTFMEENGQQWLWAFFGRSLRQPIIVLHIFCCKKKTYNRFFGFAGILDSKNGGFRLCRVYGTWSKSDRDVSSSSQSVAVQLAGRRRGSDQPDWRLLLYASVACFDDAVDRTIRRRAMEINGVIDLVPAHELFLRCRFKPHFIRGGNNEELEVEALELWLVKINTT